MVLISINLLVCGLVICITACSSLLYHHQSTVVISRACRQVQDTSPNQRPSRKSRRQLTHPLESPSFPEEALRCAQLSSPHDSSRVQERPVRLPRPPPRAPITADSPPIHRRFGPLGSRRVCVVPSSLASPPLTGASPPTGHRVAADERRINSSAAAIDRRQRRRQRAASGERRRQRRRRR